VAARLLSERQRLGSCPFHMVVKSKWPASEISLRKFWDAGQIFCTQEFLRDLHFGSNQACSFADSTLDENGAYDC
jgi:hypothetical protein